MHHSIYVYSRICRLSSRDVPQRTDLNGSRSKRDKVASLGRVHNCMGSRQTECPSRQGGAQRGFRRVRKGRLEIPLT